MLASLDQISMPFGLALAGALGTGLSVRTWWSIVGIPHLLLGLAWILTPAIRAIDQPAGKNDIAITLKAAAEANPLQRA